MTLALPYGFQSPFKDSSALILLLIIVVSSALVRAIRYNGGMSKALFPISSLCSLHSPWYSHIRNCRRLPPIKAQEHLPTFTEIAKQAACAYRITCGDEVTDYLIDVNGEGAAFLDYDNDGDQDLYLANGSSRKLQRSANPPHDYLLRNNGDGSFSDVTQKAGLGDTEWSSGVAVGDYNNDGHLDLYVTNFGPNKLYRNNGDGTFSDVSEKSGVAGPRWDMPKWSMGAAFGDYDNDGYVDLYVTNFARFNYQPELPPPSPASPCRMKGVPIACAPDKYQGTQGLLYHNNGDGTFTDVERSGRYYPQRSGSRLCSGILRL